MSQPNDKRRHPRVAQRLRVRSADEEALELETIDLSVGGLRCISPVFIAPMTKMALSLVLPGRPGRSVSGDQQIDGEAVVVRTEPLVSDQPNTGACRVALFFSRMDDADRQKLQEFLKGRAGRNGSA